MRGDEPPAGMGSLAQAMDRGMVFSDQCPSRDVLRHVTSRWGALTLLALLGGTQRFSDLRRRIKGISEKMLAETLQAQEADGFVQRFAHPVVPPHVDYALTPMGREIAQRVEGMTDWIEGNLPRILAAQAEHKAARRR